MKTFVLRMRKRWKCSDNRGFTLMEQILAMVLSVALFSCVAFVSSALIRNYVTLLKLTQAERIGGAISDGMRAMGTVATTWTVEIGDYGANVTLETEEGSYPLAYGGNYGSYLVKETVGGTDSITDILIFGQPKLMGAISDTAQYQNYYIYMDIANEEGKKPIMTIYVIDEDPLFFTDFNGTTLDYMQKGELFDQVGNHLVSMFSFSIPTADIKFG